jgi:hypothetical protein
MGQWACRRLGRSRLDAKGVPEVEGPPPGTNVNYLYVVERP